MRIGVTGATGMLGAQVIKTLKSFGYETYGLNRNDLSHTTSLLDTVDLLFSSGVSVIIHCAANTNVEQCEQEPEKCRLENILFSKTLTTAAHKLGIKMVFISSTGIYGEGKSTPYIEYDEVIPTTVYHKSKFKTENFIKRYHKNYLILRTGWLFGGNTSNLKNFVVNRLKEALSSDGEIIANPTQMGCPTFVNDVSKTILILLKNDAKGIYNVVNSGCCSRLDYVTEIISNSGLNVDVIPGEFKRLANVSYNESALNQRLVEEGFSDLPCWKLSLRKYMSSLDLAEIGHFQKPTN